MPLTDLERKARRKAAADRWRANNPEKVKAANRSRVNDPEKNRKAKEAWVQANPEKAEARRKALIGALRQQKLEDPARHLLSTTKTRASLKGFAFDLTYEYLLELIGPMRCQVSGLPLSTRNTTRNRTNPWAPSVDRIDCSKGYLKTNIRIVCWAFNQMRSDFTDEVIMQLVKALYNSYTDEAE